MSPAINNIPIIKTLTAGYTPDFIIAFTFFTSLCFAIFCKRFNHRSAETGLAISLGLTLATGLVWWEHDHNVSIRDTGSIGILLLVIVITAAVYNSIKHFGSKVAASIITIAVILTFISSHNPLLLNLNDLYSILFAVILLGFVIMAVQNTTRGTYRPRLGPGQTSLEFDVADPGIKRIHRDRDLNFNLDKHLRHLKNEADLARQNPQKASKVFQLISGLLPAEGYLTQRMAQLREKAHRIRNGHIARLKETKSLARHLPSTSLSQASSKLIHSYYTELDMDKRLERLDSAVAANEKKIIELLKKARTYSLTHRFKEIPDLIKQAEKLQSHNEKLFKTIDRSENELSKLAAQIAKQQTEGNKHAKH